MTWEILERPLQKQKTPLRISRTVLYFHENFVKSMKICDNKYVVILFNTEEKKVALRFTNTPEDNARKITIPKLKSHKNAHVEVRRLTQKIGIPMNARRDFDCMIDKNIVIFSYEGKENAHGI